MKIASYDVVFREVPDEVTLALNLSQCPHRCEGCHSPHLRDDIGEPLTHELLDALLERYGQTCTCVAFMGGDATPDEVQEAAGWVHNYKSPFKGDSEGLEIQGGARPQLRTCWYSGFRDGRVDKGSLQNLDYVKFGGYKAEFGPLNSPTTNQRMYRLQPDNTWLDITSKFWKGSPGL